MWKRNVESCDYYEDRKAWVPFEIVDKQIAPVIISVDAPVLTPDKQRCDDLGRDLMGPCEILLAGDGIIWFSFTQNRLTHNTMKIRVKIDVPLSDEVKSGKLDLCVINSDGVTAVYKSDLICIRTIISETPVNFRDYLKIR